jgi:hypothetical protein
MEYLFLPVLMLGGLALVILPVHILPVIALVSFVLIPQKVLAGSDLQLLGPSLIIIAVWLGRRYLMSWRLSLPLPARTERIIVAPQSVATKVLFLLFALVGSATLLWTLAPETSLLWLAYLWIGVAGSIFITDVTDETRLLRIAFPVIGGVLGVYSLVEFGLGRDPLFDSVYEAIGRGDYQHWSSYRADATFAHPLFAGTFFATALVLALGWWLSDGSKVAGFCTVLTGAGLLLTVSRSSIVAGIVGCVVLLIGVSLSATGSVRRRNLWATGIGFGALISIVNVGPLADRLESAEATSSNEGRQSVIDVALESAANHGWIGSGAGTSRSAALPFNFSGLPVESAYLEILISIGVAGLILGSLYFGSVCLDVFRRGDFSGLGAVIAFLVTIGFYNSLDGQRTTFVLLGLVFLVARSGGSSRPSSASNISSSKTHFVGA